MVIDTIGVCLIVDNNLLSFLHLENHAQALFVTPKIRITRAFCILARLRAGHRDRRHDLRGGPFLGKSLVCSSPRRAARKK